MSFVKKTIGFNDTWLMIVGVPFIAFIINIIMFPATFTSDPFNFLGRCFSIGLIYTLIYWLIFRWVTSYFMAKFPTENQILKRLSLQIGIMILGYFAVKVLIGNLLLLVDLEIHDPKPEPLAEITGSFMSIFLIWAIYESIIFYTKLQKSIRETEQLQKDNIQSQLEGLKNQVNPHFLFNSLNTLTYLIPEDSDKAVNFVQQLSKVYRYILEIKDQKIIPISEELEFLNSYVFLLKERFGGNLNIHIHIPPEYLKKKIVPLSLQILFENVIKHNIISTQRPLMIKVSIENDKLIIKNNLQKKNHVAGSTRMGLENIKNRYKFFTDKDVDVITTANSFLVALPLVENFNLADEEKLRTAKS